MAMRRPRIKAVANIQLNSKRKIKPTNDVNIAKVGESDVNGVQEVEKQINTHKTDQSEKTQIEQVARCTENALEVILEAKDDTTADGNNYYSDGFKNESNGNGVPGDLRENENSHRNVHIAKETVDELVNENDNFKNNNEESNGKGVQGDIHENENSLKKCNIANEAVDELVNKNDNSKNNNEESNDNGVPGDLRENENSHKNVNIAKEIVNELVNENGNSKNNNEEATETLNDSEAFKCPPKVGYQRAVSHTSNSGVDDVFYSDIEENALQMDLDKSPNGCPMSPSKNLTRQRIRPTPHFGQRRNSFIGSSPSPHTSGSEDNQYNNSNNNDSVQPTRERHNSASFSGSTHSSSSNHHYHHTPHKYLPTSVTNSAIGRIRTESGCSVFSDTNTISHKSRKAECHKQSYRKDYEARFLNGVPEKSTIKMSDLIFYNPVTNPMEQKPTPSVKLEQNESSSNDVKPFTEKLEKDTDNSEDSDAVPVPQLKLNAKGELILDDKSLVIETTAEQEARKVLANSSLIYLDENTGMNGFYSRQMRTRDWVPSETIKFYRCLQNVGTDFSLMVSLFPNRTRRDLKLKFKKEERKNGHLINKALLYPKQFDLESLKQQIEEEEKLRDEQAKKTTTKQKPKESKKRKISTSSVANRVLLSDVVYQNENDQNPKKSRKTNANRDTSSTETVQSTQNDSSETDKTSEVKNNETEQKHKQRRTKNASKKTNEQQIILNNIDETTDIQTNEVKNNKVVKTKRRRKQTPNKVQKGEIIIIKEEIIKVENRQDSNQTSALSECQDTKQLQTEIDELLDSDAMDIQYSGAAHESSTNAFPDSAQMEEYSEHINTSPCPVSSYATNYQNYNENEADTNKYEHRTIVNLDDGSVNVFSKIKDDLTFIIPPNLALASPLTRSQSPPINQSGSPPPVYPIKNDDKSLEAPTTAATIPEPEILSNDTCSSVISERELNEEDIQSILTELAEGSLVLVSTLDPDDPDKVLNEIYMVDKNTGDLCEEPLKIPDNIVQCILTVVS